MLDDALVFELFVVCVLSPYIYKIYKKRESCVCVCVCVFSNSPHKNTNSFF